MNTELLAGVEKKMFRARVEEITEHHRILVSSADGALSRRACDLLQTSEGAEMTLAPGDSVLVWWSGASDDRPVIMGRIGPAMQPPVPREKPQEIPDHLVLEAKEALHLKCGDGSITIRADGKILIQGKDLVSRALRMNRIKGGAVSIN
jgi:hypothetical protein